MSFFDDFNSELMELEDSFGEPWSFNGIEYPAIAIDDLQLTKVSGALGGPFLQASVSVFVRKPIFASSKVIKGNVIIVRDQRVRVLTTTDDGDDSITLVCGPTGVKMSE